MNWRDHVHSDPRILGCKPVFRQTRYTVERVLKLVGAGWTPDRIATEYPGILPEPLQAAAAFAADSLEHESYVATDRARAA